MQTRIEFRGISVRQLRDGAVLPVARFGLGSNVDDRTSGTLDLLDVLEAILVAKQGTDQVVGTSPEEEGEDPTKPPALRKVIAVARVERTGRTLRVDFEWSLNAPQRIFNIDREETMYRGTVGDMGMTGGTVAIRVPRTGHAAYIGVEHRSGLVSVFEPALARWFREYTPVENFRLHIAGWVPTEFWKDFLQNGQVLDLYIERYSMPRDIADLATRADDNRSMVPGGHTQIHVEVDDFHRDPAKSWLLRKWEEIRSSNSADEAGGFFYYEGNRYDRLKAKMRHRSVERTLTIGAEPDGRIAPAFPIEVRERMPGYPDHDDMIKEIRILMDDVLPSD